MLMANCCSSRRSSRCRASPPTRWSAAQRTGPIRSPRSRALEHRRSHVQLDLGHGETGGLNLSDCRANGLFERWRLAVEMNPDDAVAGCRRGVVAAGREERVGLVVRHFEYVLQQKIKFVVLH